MRVLAATLILGLFIVLVACDPFTTVTFVNESEQNLNFYTQDDTDPALLGTRSVAPRSSIDERMIRAGYRWLRVAATKEDGQWVFDQVIERSELEKLQRTIVVSSAAPIPPPSGVKVIPYQGAPLPVQLRSY